jgi:4-hydroxy-4-methyl-2-oxoglutarate aldolase
MEIKRIDRKIIDGFLSLSTSAISDALDRFGLRGGCEGIFPVAAGVKMAGPAFTLRYVPIGQVKGNVGDYM